MATAENKCLTTSEVFTQDCRNTVFDAPCPDQFVNTNTIVGNLVIRDDPVFGGGRLSVTGGRHHNAVQGITVHCVC